MRAAILPLLLLSACAPEAPRDMAAGPLPLVVGPGGAEVASDPCPEAPGAPAACARLVTARRISWYGWLARWMHVYRTLGVPAAEVGARGQWTADALNLGFGHPDRLLGALVEPDGVRSQYFAFHEVLGEPLDRIADETASITGFRLQHSSLVTAAAVKQACRISIALADRLSRRLVGRDVEDARLAVLERVLDVERSGARVERVRGLRPEFGYFSYGRRLDAAELATVNDGFAGDGREGLRQALAALMCSTPALVE